MPFIKPEERKRLLEAREQPNFKFFKSKEVPGNLCFLHYYDMVKQWKERPRWTTAHQIYKKVVESQLTSTENPLSDDRIALELAWKVFFQLHVIPYEREKQSENGDI